MIELKKNKNGALTSYSHYLNTDNKYIKRYLNPAVVKGRLHRQAFLSCWWLKEIKKNDKVKAAQSCPTLCYPMDCIVHGILQARILEWIAFPSLGDLPNPGIEFWPLELQADSLPSWATGEAQKKWQNLALLIYVWDEQFNYVLETFKTFIL